MISKRFLKSFLNNAHTHTHKFISFKHDSNNNNAKQKRILQKNLVDGLKGNMA